MVKLYAPLLAGVPEMTPVDAFRDNPVGNDPAFTDHVMGTEPVAVTICEYVEPEVGVPPSADVVIVGATGDPTLPVNCLVAVPNPLMALTVKLYEPDDVGLPYSWPAVDSDSPAIKVPAETVHKIGDVPETAMA
jgi:hypothetical protein